jgi:hypothetical protein
MIIPNFETKDSYILKYKLDYDVSLNNNLSASTYNILFIDNNLARKSQYQNNENFEAFEITGTTSGLTNYSEIHVVYYDKEFILNISNNVDYSTNFSNITFENNSNYQSIYINPSEIVNFNINDYLEIELYKSIPVSGITTWSHYGQINDIWYVSGITSGYDIDNLNRNFFWELTGLTTQNGLSSGSTTYSFNEIIPILKYNVFIDNTTIDYIIVEKKLEDYLYNNILKMNNVYYNVKNINYTTSNYIEISNTLEKTYFANYFNVTNTSNSLIITPKKNINDIYFDYDKLTFICSGLTTNIFNFNTYNIYNKYTLEKFFEQLGIPSDREIFYNNIENVSGITYSGTFYYSFDLLNSLNIIYFKEYTYINLNTNLNTYISLIYKIEGSTITIITSPRMEDNYNNSIVENIVSIQNLYKISDISLMLNECYIN